MQRLAQCGSTYNLSCHTVLATDSACCRDVKQPTNDAVLCGQRADGGGAIRGLPVYSQVPDRHHHHCGEMRGAGPA